MMDAVTKFLILLVLVLNPVAADEILKSNGVAGPENAWAYLRVDDVGQRQNRNYIPNRGPLQRAEFIGYVSYNPHGGWKKDANGVPDEDVIRVFCTYALSKTNQKLRVRVGGDDGHAFYADGVLVAKAGVGEEATGMVEFIENQPVYIELLGFNGPLSFQLTIDKFTDTKGIELNADGKFEAKGMAEPARLQASGGYFKDFQWPISVKPDHEPEPLTHPVVAADNVDRPVVLPSLDHVNGQRSLITPAKLTYLTAGQLDAALLQALIQLNTSTHVYSTLVEKQRSTDSARRQELRVVRGKVIDKFIVYLDRFLEGRSVAYRADWGSLAHRRLINAKTREKAEGIFIREFGIEDTYSLKLYFLSLEKTRDGRIENNQLLKTLGRISDKESKTFNRIE